MTRASWVALLLVGSACGAAPSGEEPDDGARGSGGATTGEESGGSKASGGNAPEIGGKSSADGGAASGGLPPGSGGAGANGGAESGGGSPSASGGESTGGDAGDAGGSSSGGSPSGGASGGAPPGCAPHVPASRPIGYGRATTGGGNTEPIVVRSFAEAEAALAAYRSDFKKGARSSLVIHYGGKFDFSTITDVCAQHNKDSQILQIKEMENVTFRGLSGSSSNFGIKVNRAKNVIIQNMVFGLLPGGGDSDAITLEGNGTSGDVENVWIDHNEFFSSTKDDCPGAGDTEFDGLIDIKKGARRITISYNYLHDHQKTGLIGSSDSDDTERYITFHHNRYENVVSRTPLQRFGYTHLFNNYYGKISSSGINVRMGGVAFIEANYFEDAKNPVTSRYSDEPGYWDLRDNFVGPGITWNTESDTLANADTWETTKVFPASELDYDYDVEPAECVKASVFAAAGARL